jgi:hypothetical protein
MAHNEKPCVLNIAVEISILCYCFDVELLAEHTAAQVEHSREQSVVYGAFGKQWMQDPAPTTKMHSI